MYCFSYLPSSTSYLAFFIWQLVFHLQTSAQASAPPEIWHSSSLFPAWDGVSLYNSETPHARFLLESKEISWPLKRNYSFECIEFEKPKFSWLVEASGHFSSTLFYCLYLHGMKLLFWLILSYIAQWARAVVPWFHECPFSSSICCWTQQASSSNCLCVCLVSAFGKLPQTSLFLHSPPGAGLLWRLRLQPGILKLSLGAALPLTS